MSRIWALLMFGSALIFAGLAWITPGTGQETRSLQENRIPEFAMKALASPTASKPGIFIAKDGTITRFAVHLGREGVPEWLHAMADEKIGKGEDMTYEAEIYPDGSEVYEVYRKVGGKEKQLSVAHRDRSVKYVGTQMDEAELPEKVLATLKGVKEFTLQRCMFKEGPHFAEYHFRGTIAGTPHRVRIGRDGKLLAIQRRIPGDFEVAQE